MTDITGVFEGGGVKGIALAGAAAAALDHGYRFTAAVGTSAGGLVAALVAAGCGPDELERMICDIPWHLMLDRRPLGRVPMLGPHLSMMVGGGMARGHRLERQVSTILAGRGVHDFGDLASGALRVVVTDLTHGRGVVLPDGLAEYGIDPVGFPVARAVRASTAVPFVFEPLMIRNPSTGENIVLADGSLAARFPIQLVAPGAPMVGFRLVPSDGNHQHHQIGGPFSLAAAVIAAGMTARESLPVLCREIGTTVNIEVDRPALDFDLSSEEAHTMFCHARRSAFDQLPLPSLEAGQAEG